MKLRQNFELLMLCILIGIAIVYLRLFASYPANVVNIVKGIWQLLNYYAEVLGLDLLSSFFGMFTANQMMFLMVLTQIIVGAMLLKLFRERLENGAQILETNPFRVIRWGIIWYLLLIFTMIVFALSVVGLGITFAFGLIIVVISLISGVCIALTLGDQLKSILGIGKRSIFIVYMLGEFVIALCTSVNVLSGVILCFMIPVLSLGIAWCSLMDKFIYKGSARNKDDKTDKFDRNRIRDIITNGVND